MLSLVPEDPSSVIRSVRSSLQQSKTTSNSPNRANKTFNKSQLGNAQMNIETQKQPDLNSIALSRPFPNTSMNQEQALHFLITNSTKAKKSKFQDSKASLENGGSKPSYVGYLQKN